MKKATNKINRSGLSVLQPRLLNIAAAAAYLSATTWFVRTLIWDGAVPHCRFGKRLLIDRADLDAFVTAQKQEE